MSGYTRQSTADIIPTATVRAAPLNAEYNALRDAFAAPGGHKHDGTTAEGAYVPLIADLDANNKVQVNTGANTVDFYVEVAGVPVEQISVRDGVIRPITDNDIDLGAVGSEFKDLYIDGIGYIDTLAVHENATVAGTLNVTGVITAPAGVVANITGNLTGDVTGDVTGDLTGDVTSTGTSTFSDLDAVDLSATGTTVIASIDLNSGAIDGTAIGTTTPAAGTFTTLNADTSLVATTADINGGTLDGVVIGSGTSAAATVTDLTATGTSTLSTVDINAGAIDGTTVGASVPSTGAFTTVSTTGQATLASADINGGAIDGTTVGASVPATGAFTTVSASGGVTANVTGNLTGNVTGNVSGDITGDVTGDLTGNVTASSGSSTFNNVTIDGTLNMNAGTTATIQNLTAPTNDLDAATKKYVDDEVAGVVAAAPAALDTLNELAAALGDDANFSTTVTNSIATKLPLAGGTMSGEIAMGSNKITGAADPTGAQDVATKVYTDTQRDTRVAKSGDTMSGALAMGNNKITGLATPTSTTDATNKTYVDGLLGSSTDAATSAANAATSETNAATSETNAGNSASAAAASEANAAASYDNFDDRYLGAKSSPPTVDNDGDALIVGALYFNSTSNIMYVYGGAGWQAAGSSVNGTSDRQTYTATAGQTVFAASYDTGYIDVYLNGVKLVSGTDFTATNGTSVTLTSGAAVNDTVDLVAYGTFVLADHYTETQSDARYVQVAGDTMTGNLDVGGTVTADGLTVDGNGSVITTTGTSGDQDILSFARPTYGEVGKVSRSSGSMSVLSDQNLTIGADYTNTNSGANSNIYAQTDGVTRLNINGGGDISFYEDTGTTPKFFWDASAERLGIGTDSPSEELEIASSSPTIRLTDTDDSTHGAVSYNVGALFLTGDQTVRFNTDGTEAMRIDSSGNLLVGKTSADLSTNGVSITPSGSIFTRDGFEVLALNRKTSDGSIIDFYKDGSTVGSIGCNSGLHLVIGKDDTGLNFQANEVIAPSNPSTGAARDNAIDLGGSSSRFKDGHFSGTVNATSFSGDGSALTGVGGSTTAGAVGTYAWLVNRSQDNGSAWGGTMAGSSLGSAGLATNNNTNASSSGNVTASGRSIGTTQTGTWRAMGQSNFSGMYDSRTTLFVRIA